MTSTASIPHSSSQGSLAWPAAIGQIFLFGAVFCLVLLFLVPLTPLAADILLLLNIIGALVLLFITLTTDDPSRLTSFPSLLLLGTCLRLGLTIGTTRLILSDGEAGRIVSAIGDVVIAGNLITGFVVCLVILIVQFVVVTKGAERVAEVSARFTLDALPGKQMSIDADVRAGLLSNDEAKSKRAELGRESRVYGAMDGAMKFIKGETLAGFVIMTVNFFGGLATGVLVKELNLSQAATHYGLLTIGESIAAQIPAFLSTLASGFLVTRVAEAGQESGLGAQIGRQWFRDSRVLGLASVALAAMSLIPDFPTLILGTAALALATLGLLIRRQDHIHQASEHAVSRLNFAPDEALHALGRGLPLLVKVGPLMSEHFANDSRWQECFQDLYPKLRRHLTRKTGVPFPDLFIESVEALPPHHYQIAIHELVVAEGALHSDQALVRMHIHNNVAATLPAPTKHTTYGTPALSVPLSDCKDWETRGHIVYRPEDMLLRHLTQVLKRHAVEFIGIQEIRKILSELEQDHSELVREVVPRMISVQRLTEVIRRLVEEGVPIRDFRLILETIAGANPDTKNAATLTEEIRAGLKRVLSHHVTRNGRNVAAFLLDTDLQQELADNIRTENGECQLVIEPERLRAITTAIVTTYRNHDYRGREAVILCQGVVRRYVRKIIEDDLPEAAVLAFHELEAHLVIDTRDVIGLTNQETIIS